MPEEFARPPDERGPTMTLLDEAERAEKIRNAFIVFASHCANDHDAIQDINKAISELSSLSCALREIDKLLEVDSGAGLALIHDNLKCVHEDITWTLSDVWQCLGRLGRSYTSEDYQMTWAEITEQAKDVSRGKKLHRVLESYKRFVESLSKSMESHITTPTIDIYEDEIRGIHARRVLGSRPERYTTGSTTPIIGRSSSQKRIPARIPTLSKGSSLRMQPPQSPGIKQPKSYERERPMSPDDSSVSSASDATRFRTRPWAPSPPLSPAVTISSTSQVSSAAPSLEASPNHWAKQVFKNVSSTPLPWSNEETRYHEVQGAKEHSFPNQAYDNVLTLMYPEGVRVSLFCRAADYRSKMAVLYRDRRGNSEYGCLPLDELHLRREGSLLRVCRRKSSGKPMIWVSMKFTTIERMVLFTSTFIAMRSQDASTRGPPPAIDDDELRDEVREFAGAIVDSSFSHALRIYRDKITGAIRLQASVLRGELDRLPVWTAFITHFIASPDWCRRVDRKTIALADLKLHIFSSRYRPQPAPSGAFMLRFEMKEDAEAFLEGIEELRMSLGGYQY